jgi:hypothetical protein
MTENGSVLITGCTVSSSIVTSQLDLEVEFIYIS